MIAETTIIYRSAQFSPCQRYRYALTRVWQAQSGRVLFIGLNPSTADAKQDDATLSRCIQFAKSWGYGGVYIANLFAYRSTDPKNLLTVDNPVGDDNDSWIRRLAADADLMIAAWGNYGRLLNRNQFVRDHISPLYYLKLTLNGEPAHPLYLKKTLTPKRLLG